MLRNSKVFARVIFLVIISSFLIVSLGEASSYYLNQKEDEYTYEDQHGGTLVARVDHSTWTNWNHWTEFAGFGPVWVITFNCNEFVFIYANNRVQLFANFNASVGSMWFIDAGSCNRKVTVVLAAREEKIEVPAGTFTDCIRIDLNTSCADGGTESIWFAKDVGIVKWISQSIAGPNPWEFKEGLVNGKKYPPSVPLALPLKGGTDRFEYFIDMMPSPVDTVSSDIPPQKPTLLHGVFSITNNSGDPIDFVFGACEFDIYIYDARDIMVSNMNRGNNVCYQEEIAINKTLENGETWLYEGDVELTDEGGNALPEGYYKVECVLNATPGFSTLHTIKISYAY